MYMTQILYFKAEADLPQNEDWALRPSIYTDAFFSHSEQILICVHNSVFYISRTVPVLHKLEAF